MSAQLLRLVTSQQQGKPASKGLLGKASPAGRTPSHVRVL